MDRPGDEFLSRARFPGDEDGDSGLAHQRDELFQLSHGTALAYQGILCPDPFQPAFEKKTLFTEGLLLVGFEQDVGQL